MIDALRNYSTKASTRPSSYRHLNRPVLARSVDEDIALTNCTIWNSSEPNWCLEAAPLLEQLILGSSFWEVPNFAEATIVKELSMGLKWPDADRLHSTCNWLIYPEKVLRQGGSLRSASDSWIGTLDSIIVELGRLSADWDGEGSVLPSQKLLRDIDTALRVLPSKTPEPNIDVDSSDGSVGLTWDIANGRHVAASFSGNGRIFVFVGCPEFGNWSASATADDDVRILELFDRAFGKVEQPA